VKSKLDNDYILVSNVLNGDTDSFSLLVSKYKDGIYNFIYKMTFSREDAEDILQEVFIRVYNNLYKYDNRWHFSTWLYRIALNVFKSHYSKKKKQRNIDYQEVLSSLPDNLINNPELVYEMKEHNLEILKILDSVKFEDKTILVLKHIQGFSYREIAEILKLSPENVRIKVMRAKKILYKKFNEHREV
jgi:RNA polymerase sigma-70 factor (ECF subfamily)